MEAFVRGLKLISKIYHDEPINYGCSEEQVKDVEQHLGFLLPEVLRDLYLTVGEDRALMAGNYFSFRRLEELTVVRTVFQTVLVVATEGNGELGIDMKPFEAAAVETGTYRLVQYDGQYAQWINGGNQGKEPEERLMFHVVYNAFVNMKDNLSITFPAVAEETHGPVAVMTELLGAKPFVGIEDMRFLFSFSEQKNLLCKYDSEGSHRYVVASNDTGVMEALAQMYPSIYLRKDGVKIMDAIRIQETIPPKTFDEKLSALRDIILGKINRELPAGKIRAVERRLGIEIPTPLFRFYELCGKGRIFLKCRQNLAGPEELTVVDGILHIGNIRGGDDFGIILKSNEPVWVGPDGVRKVGLSLENFILALTAQQTMGFLKVSGCAYMKPEWEEVQNILEKSLYPYVEVPGPIKVYASRHRKLIVYTTIQAKHTVFVSCASEAALIQFEHETGIFFTRD